MFIDVSYETLFMSLEHRGKVCVVYVDLGAVGVWKGSEFMRIISLPRENVHKKKL